MFKQSEAHSGQRSYLDSHNRKKHILNLGYGGVSPRVLRFDIGPNKMERGPFLTRYPLSFLPPPPRSSLSFISSPTTISIYLQ